MTEGDYREIARTFLEGEDEELRARLGPMIESEDFWPSWMSALHRTDTQIRKRWGQYRVDRIESAFLEPLVGLKEDARRVALDALRDSRAVAQKGSRSAQKPTAAVRGKFKLPSDPAQLRERDLVLAVVGRMSNDELRRMELPVGLVLDVLREGS